MNSVIDELTRCSHHYEDKNAIVFTFPVLSPSRLSEAIFDCLAAHPIAQLPLTLEDFPPRQPRKPRVLSVETLARRQRRKEQKASEKEFLKAELAQVSAAKFLDLLERDKAIHLMSNSGSRQKTWIYVEYQGKRLGLCTFEWIVGDARPYVHFSKERP